MKARVNASAWRLGGRRPDFFFKGEDEEFTAERWKRGNV